MAKDWIERSNIEFHGQAKRFTEAIVGDPGAYGVDPATAAQLAAEFADFDAKYLATISKLSRNTLGVVSRDAARKKLAKRMRAIAMTVRGNPAVTYHMKVVLGMTVEASNPPPPPSRPDTTPWLYATILPNGRLGVVLKESDSSRRGIPRQIAGAQIFIAVGQHYGPPVRLEQWQLLAVVSKAKTEIDLPFIPAGSPVSIAARWYNTHGAGRSSNTAVVWVGEILTLPPMQTRAA